MIVLHADLRNLQHSEYANRGVGQLTRSLLGQARNFAPREIEIVGLLDPRLPSLETRDRGFVDATLPVTNAPRQSDIFVQSSPMTANQEVVLRFLRDRSIIKATVVYDFIPHDRPKHYLRSDPQRVAYRAALFYLYGYDWFFPISEYSRRRLIELTGIGEDRAITIGAPIRRQLRRATAAPVPRDPPYFLTVAGDDWRKNVECPVAAFARLAEDGDAKSALVIVGTYSAARQAAIVSGLPAPLRARVHFRTDLTDTEMAELYAGAVATICPSRIEGFSLPVVEALTCGSPVLLSDCAAQVELIDDPDILFAPDDVERLTGLMASLLDQPLRREALLARQRPVTDRFGEEIVGEKFWTPIFATHEKKRASAPFAVRGVRPRIAFVTPYPPDASGVAFYSARTLTDIAKRADVDLFTDAAVVDKRDDLRHAGPISSFPYFSRRYDRVVSVVGNSNFHSRIVDYVRDFGGACVQHDNRMADFYMHLRGFGKFAEMLKSAGAKKSLSHADALEGLLKPEVFGSLFFDEIVHAAAPFMVHSRTIARNVKAQYGVEAIVLPFAVQRDFSDSELEPSHRDAVRKRLGIAPDRVAIVTLGIPAGSKGNVECIEALALLRKGGMNAALYFVGEANDYSHLLRRTAAARGVKNFVHFMPKRPSEATYRDFIVAADLCIQLRTTGLGGLSAALLDAIGAGLPGIANADLADALDAPGYISRVPDRFDAASVAAQAFAIVGDGLHRRVGRQRSDFAASHSSEQYARDMMAALGFES
ncbi:MAG: glycosyltransferase [Stellaceae bacterium]